MPTTEEIIEKLKGYLRNPELSREDFDDLVERIQVLKDLDT